MSFNHEKFQDALERNSEIPKKPKYTTMDQHTTFTRNDTSPPSYSYLKERAEYRFADKNGGNKIVKTIKSKAVKPTNPKSPKTTKKTAKAIKPKVAKATKPKAAKPIKPRSAKATKPKANAAKAAKKTK